MRSERRRSVTHIYAGEEREGDVEERERERCRGERWSDQIGPRLKQTLLYRCEKLRPAGSGSSRELCSFRLLGNDGTALVG